MNKGAQYKKRISLTISPVLDDLLENISLTTKSSKSSLVEMALSNYLDKKLEEDAKFMSNLDFKDLPSENDWLKIQSLIR